MAFLPRGIDLSTIPLAAPPPGVTSNFVDPESLATPATSVAIFMLVMTALVVIVRLFSNYHATRGLGWDDCFCIIATVLFLIYVAFNIEARRTARHEYDIPIIWISPSWIKKLFVLTITAGPTTFFAKLSLFMLYYRLFKPHKVIRYAIFFGITFSFITYFGHMTAYGILCTPEVGHPWDLTVAAKCSRSLVNEFVLGIANLALDTFLFILPIPVILTLQLSVKKKIGVLAIFMVGFFAVIASIVSLVYRFKLWHGTDISWNRYICAICVMIEIGVTIMCGSTSALVTFWKSHMASYVTPRYSRLCSRYGELAARLRFISRASSDTQVCPDISDPSKSYPGLYNLDYVELDEHHQRSTGFPHIIRTQIGCGSPRSEVEQGVIRKFMKVEQSFN